MKGMFFKPEMNLAIREDRKHATRRIEECLAEINKEPDKWRILMVGDVAHCWGMIPSDFTVVKPRYRVGGIVYVKEAWATENQYNHLKPREIPRTAQIFYLSDGYYDPFIMGKRRSPLFMPEWSARIFPKILEVKPQRLQSMTEQEAKAEGFKADVFTSAKKNFAAYFEVLHPGSWERNEWVIVYKFEVIK